jgi:hypothetical protein
MSGALGTLWGYLWPTKPTRKPQSEAAQKLLTSVRIASRCKYQAAGRLKRLSMFSFYATTLLSLGLIAIPLIMDSGIAKQFPDSVLTMVQIFLAVAVLVFSAVIGTARYELRAYLLDKCGHQLKNLARKIDTPPAKSDQELIAYVEEYFKLTQSTENHSPADYRAAILSMRDVFTFKGTSLPFYWICTLSLFALPYVVPGFFILCEFCFITDMLSLPPLIPESLRIVQ